MYYDWKPYVSVAERRRNAEREMAKLSKKGHAGAPIRLQGRLIAKTFWGKAWCDNLEAYSDYANRLPRGRTYVRNGSVVDLQVIGGEVKALVSGSSLYKVSVTVAPIPQTRWQAICKDCAGSIDSLVELLQGKLSKAVMERVCQQKTGLFPAPAEITLDCSCPDWASMCKHVAAVLYGIGARLDEQPALIFKLRAVNEADLIAAAARGQRLATKGPATAKVLEDDLAALFGLEMEQAAPAAAKATKSTKAAAATARPTRKAGTASTGRAAPAPAKKAPPTKAKPAALPIRVKPAVLPVKAKPAKKVAGKVRASKATPTPTPAPNPRQAQGAGSGLGQACEGRIEAMSG